MDKTKKQLHDLARMYGVYTSYTDIDGNLQVAEPEMLTSVLQSLGASVESAVEVEDALVSAETETANQLVEPVSVVWDQGELAIKLLIPPELAEAKGKCRLEKLDDCGAVLPANPRISQSWEFDFNLKSAPILTTHESGNHTRLSKILHLPLNPPFGYYNFHIELAGKAADGFIISAPRRSPQLPDGEKHWGAFLPLYSMHSKRSQGIGDFTDLHRFSMWIGKKGGTLAGVLPVLNQFYDYPYEYSPYVPASRLFLNEIFIDLDAIPEMEDCPEARKLVESPVFKGRISKLLLNDQVNYRECFNLKIRVLSELSKTLFKKQNRRFVEFQEFIDLRPDTVDFSEFRAVGARRRKPWQKWPQRLQDGRIIEGDYDPDTANTFKYAQWIAAEQLAGVRDKISRAGVDLYLDMPLGVHQSSYDTYREREVFANGVSAGAPPDPLFLGGQNWGFPPFHPCGIRLQKYRYFINIIRYNLSYAKVLRLDHIMGFHRLFWIPAGAAATRGVYVRYHPEEFYAVLCYEARRSGSVIIGEDLGTVPDAVRTRMDEHGLHRMHIFQLEVGAKDDGNLPEIPANCLAALNTHDTATFAGFLESLDIQDQERLGLIDRDRMLVDTGIRASQVAVIENYLRRLGWLEEDNSPEELVKACLRYLAASRAKIMLLNIEDTWHEDKPQNVPGTWRERPNWLRKAEYPLERMTTDRKINSFLREITQLRVDPHLVARKKRALPEIQLKRISLRKEVERVAPVKLPNGVISLFSDDDIYLFNEGLHFQLYNHLGAHPLEIDGKKGTCFAVWAPNADYVSVIGDFNSWNPQANPLTSRASSGIWEGFIPGVSRGFLYKYFIKSRDSSHNAQKADPFATYSEIPPRTASIVWDLDYAWNDDQWMKKRGNAGSLTAPISIYEVHLGSWRRVPEENNRFLTYSELADQLVEYVREMGYTHVEFMPVSEHPFYGSWGYQGTGFFSPTSRYGTPSDFMFLIDSLHQAEIGVILDWVSSHFPNDEHALAKFDGTFLYEHVEPRQRLHPDWNSHIFNYGRHEIKSYLFSSALFWFHKYHIDGIRVDSVASMLYLDYSRNKGEWIPNRYGGAENLDAVWFLRRLNEEIYRNFPDVQTIAEESTSWPRVSRPTWEGGLGFGMKWDMGWMHDTLQYLRREPIHRQYHHNELTFRLMYAFHENFVLALSHDEVVHEKASLLGKMSGDGWQKFASLRLLYAYMYSQPGKKLMFMGCEFGQWREWDHESSLDWHLVQYKLHSGLQRCVKDLNRIYRTESCMHELDTTPSGFEWVIHDDSAQSCLSYLRRNSRGEVVLICLNFTPVTRSDYLVGVPVEGRWREIFNSDAEIYGGSGTGNDGGATAIPMPFQGRYNQALSLTLPPLGAVFLKPEK